MEIVIKIPDEVLESKHYCQYFGVGSTKLTETIENGTVLPKGHGRLIDIDNIESIMMEDSVDRMVHTKGDEVDWYIEAPTIVEADKG